jgi:hypothetical protein
MHKHTCLTWVCSSGETRFQWNFHVGIYTCKECIKGDNRDGGRQHLSTCGVNGYVPQLWIIPVHCTEFSSLCAQIYGQGVSFSLVYCLIFKYLYTVFHVCQIQY